MTGELIKCPSYSIIPAINIIQFSAAGKTISAVTGQAAEYRKVPD